MIRSFKNYTIFSDDTFLNVLKKYDKPGIEIDVIVDDDFFAKVNGYLGGYQPKFQRVLIHVGTIRYYRGSKGWDRYNNREVGPYTFEEQLESTIAHELHHAYQHQVLGTLPGEREKVSLELHNAIEREAHNVGYEAVQALRRGK